MNAYRSMQHECPGCGGVMETMTTVGAATVELCPRCLGVWVDSSARDLARIARNFAPLPDAPPVPAGRESCPRCDEPLAFHAIPGISSFVHWCPRCTGTFLPRRAVRELAALKQAPARVRR